MSEESGKKPFGPNIEIRGKMDIEDIAKRQIDRVNASGYEPDETLFASSVLVLRDLLPTHKRADILSRQMEYGEMVEFVEYTHYWCGRPMSSTAKIVERYVVNYHQLYQIVLDAYQESGLTWQIEPELRVRKRDVKIIPPPRPKIKEVENVDPKTDS